MKIEIYTRDGCNYCELAKELLGIEGRSYIEYNLSRGDVTREQVFQRLNIAHDTKISLPVVFINDNYVGGYTELTIYFANEVLSGKTL